MAVNGFFFNAEVTGNNYDRTYTAENFCDYLEHLVGNGVFANPSSNLQVSAGNGMTINVAAGQGWINGHKIVNTTILPLTITPSDVVLNRIDRIIFYLDHIERKMGIDVLRGQPSVTPTAPELTRTTERYELSLALVNIDKQVGTITNANIEDTRGDSEVCGYVAGLIEQIDTTSLFQQFTAQFEESIATSDANFNEWFNQVKTEVPKEFKLLRKYDYVYTTTLNSEDTFDVKAFIPDYGYALDVLEVRISGLVLNENEYQQNEGVVNLATPITHIGTEIEFVVYQCGE